MSSILDRCAEIEAEEARKVGKSTEKHGRSTEVEAEAGEKGRLASVSTVNVREMSVRA